MKVCRKCGISKPIDMFYKHKGMKDGHLHQCIQCKNSYSIQYHEANRDSILKRKKKWNISMEGRASFDKYRQANKLKHYARLKVQKARKKGRIIRPLNCSGCNGIGRIDAHHNDYAKPLEVVWLCTSCHYKLHRNSHLIIRNLR